MQSDNLSKPRLDYATSSPAEAPVDQQTSRYANAIQMGNPWLLKWNNQKGTPHGVKSSKCELSSANCMSKITDTLTARVMQQVFNPTFTVRPAICTDGNERNVFDVAIHLRVYTQTFEKGGHVTAEEWHASPNYNREDWVRLAKSLVDYVGNHSVIPAVLSHRMACCFGTGSPAFYRLRTWQPVTLMRTRSMKHNMHAAENNDAMETMFTIGCASLKHGRWWRRRGSNLTDEAPGAHPEGSGQAICVDVLIHHPRWGLLTYAKLTTQGLISFPCDTQIDSARNGGRSGQGTQIT